MRHNEERLLKLLQAPLISEKSSIATQKFNQYVFKVVTDATKKEIKQAVEKLFSVEVLSVTVINMKPKKTKRSGRGIQGKHSAWKKAYVRLKSGQTIDLVGAKA